MSEEEFEHTRMTLGEHIAELRSRLVKGLGAVALAFGLAWFAYEPISVIVMRPFDQAVARINAHWAEEFAERVAEGEDPLVHFTTADPATWELRERYKVADRLTALAPTEGFTFVLRICFYFALFLGGPVLLWQLWQFIAAGLYPKERRAAVRYFPYSLLLFALGVAFGYFVMVPFAMYFLGVAFDTDLVQAQYRLEDYLSLLSALCLALAVVFQLPVFMTFAARMGLVTPKQMSGFRSYFIVGAFVIAAILTPPDPFTQTMMAIPMIFLYEVGIVAARMTARPREVPEHGVPV